jgi:hypothetical protein
MSSLVAGAAHDVETGDPQKKLNGIVEALQYAASGAPIPSYMISLLIEVSVSSLGLLTSP